MKKLPIYILFVAPSLVCSAPKPSDSRIVYENSSNGISIICPADDSGLSVGEIKNKDVPNGAKFKIIQFDMIPSDRSKRNQWTYDETKGNGIDAKGAGVSGTPLNIKGILNNERLD